VRLIRSKDSVSPRPASSLSTDVRIPIKPASGSPSAQRKFLWFFMLFWNGILIVMIGAALASRQPLALICMSLHIAVGVWLFCTVCGPIIRALKMAPPEVTVSKDTVRLGERFDLSFLQEIRQPINITRFCVELVFRESATYQQGTDTKTVTHEVPIQSYQFAPRRAEAGERIREDSEFTIPAEGMHSFAAVKNKIQWIVKVAVEVEKWPDFKEEYEVRVLPDRVGAA